MCSSINRAGWLLAGLLLALAPARAQELPPAEILPPEDMLPDADAEVLEDILAVPELPEPDDPYLEIYSEGSSRFEFVDGNLIATYADGVEFSYHGYRLTAGELSLDQARRTVEVTSGFTLHGEDIAISGQSAAFDSTAGAGTLAGGLRGSLLDGQLNFGAESIELRFPADSTEPRLSETTILISDVVLTDATGNTVETQELTFDGALMQISTAEVMLLAAIPDPGLMPRDPEAAEAPRLLPVRLRGAGLTGQLDDSGELTSAGISDLLLVAPYTFLSAGSAQVQFTETGALNLELSEQVGLETMLKGNPALLEASAATANLDGQGLKEIALSDVNALALGNRFSAPRLALARSPEGLSIAAEDSLRIGLNLAGLLGVEPIDVAELLAGED